MKRIDYIDLMKGICIVLVIWLHCGFDYTNSLINIEKYVGIFRMPLYFFLTGLFFSTYGSFKKLVIKKINNLVIPYIFFSSLMLFPYLLFPSMEKDLSDWHTYVSLFLYPDNFPLWFLRCLFIAYLWYFLLSILCTKSILKIIVSFLVSLGIWFFFPYSEIYKDTFLYRFFWGMNIGTALFILPFISVAEYLRKKGILVKEFRLKYKLIAFSLSIFLWIVCITDHFNLLVEKFSDNIFLFYVSSFSGIFMILIFSSIIRKIFLISYLGRYSLIVLGTHAVLSYILFRLGCSKIEVFCVVLIISPFVIYLFKKLFPYFCAVKILVGVEDNKVVFFPKKENP